ncbi:MAG TPA: ATP-dependent helicase C-terminal domain-containing protein [Candidatus Paceibacterota bacterium]|nr:ATP-dependent helicase C-terminal domain-containing protein [Verrucomicrobiota bacterium]HSA09891.1 ATP-dependent helicase C-terminal domain-containing protein [Candidatus Paceibacterota bacterium]
MNPASLPIWQIHSAVVETLRLGNRLVLVAPTGSGKTTQVPQMLLDAGLAGQRKIVVLQPRRVAARTVAARVAWERGARLGGEVGYQIRFDDQTSLGTRISYVTEGILLRWLQDDRVLSEVGVVIFDEFHERNLLSDVALALVKQLQRTARPDLKVAVMSATLEAEPVAEYLSGGMEETPVLYSEGQSFPVEVRYLNQHDERPASEQAADVVEQIVNAGEPGDILVFMPGMGEINATIAAARASRTRERLALIPLHGDLPPEQQDLAFAPNALRKVVVATNVAETSVTIEGIRHVVDSGLARVARYDAERGIGTLFIEPISRASAEQRKGRAGRTAPGTCHRLWTESGQLNRAERNTPEIQRSDLAEVVLLLHSLGIKRAAEFDWLDKPDAQAVERAEQLLVTLGALRDDQGTTDDSRNRPQTGALTINHRPPIAADLTPVGRQMLKLPMHPRYSRMLVEAAKFGCVPSAALCAALVSGRDMLVRPGRNDKHIQEARELFEASRESDFHTLLRAYHFAKKNNFSIETCRRYGIHAQTARQVEQAFEQILQIANQQGLLRSEGESPLKEDDAGARHAGRDAAPADPLPRCIMAGFIDQICLRHDQGTLDCDLTEGRHGTLMRESVVQNAPLFVAATIREVTGRGSENLTLLGLATAVKREWIEETFPEQITVKVEHLYDRTHKRVAAVKLVRFRDLVIHHEHQRDVDPRASGRCLAEASRKGWFELPMFNHETKQLIGRVNLVTAAMPELEFPPFDEAAITNCLARAFEGLTLAKEAQATALRDAFRQALANEQLGWLDELTPTSLAWPDGRKMKLLYSERARDEDAQPNAPELQVKLHECFALKAHPHVCEGRLPVKLWLCAPDGKRLEATFNWTAFRLNTYPKLKPALQKKYPGVPWP